MKTIQTTQLSIRDFTDRPFPPAGPISVTRQQLHEFLSGGPAEFDNYGDYAESVTDEGGIQKEPEDSPDFHARSGGHSTRSEGNVLPEKVWTGLKAADIKNIIADFGMSENHIGGDDVVSMIEETVDAMSAGYTIITWYGPDTEALVAGIRSNQIQISDL